MDCNDWTSDNIPNLSGKNIIVTGANSGLGLEAASVLCRHGAHVIMAVRNLEKGTSAMQSILNQKPMGTIDLMHLDLADLNSIQIFSNDFHTKYTSLHLLINNAGVMFPKTRIETKQKFELQFGTNHLGHFALTGLLLDLIIKTPHARVVSHSSMMHQVLARINFDDLNSEKSYNKTKAYAQSKLANLLFTYELDRKFKEYHIHAIATAAHPGYTITKLQKASGFWVNLSKILIAQKVKIGVLPILRASTEEGLIGSEYFGPTKWFGLRGYPKKIKSSGKSQDVQLAENLWKVSEELTGLRYNFKVCE